MHASAAMTRDVVCIAPADDLDAAWALMKRMRIRHVPVLDGATPVGILSDRDVLLHASQSDGGVEVPAIPVQNVMTRDLITCSPASRISHLAELMLEHKIDSVLVLDAGSRLVGLVTSSDLLELLRSRDEAADKIIPFDFHLRTDMLRTGVA